jgi:hypothetical protein
MLKALKSAPHLNNITDVESVFAAFFARTKEGGDPLFTLFALNKDLGPNLQLVRIDLSPDIGRRHLIDFSLPDRVERDIDSRGLRESRQWLKMVKPVC